MKSVCAGIAALALWAGAACACGLGTPGIAALNAPGWKVDVILGLRQWDGGSLRLPEPSGQAVETSGSARGIKMSFYAGDRRMKPLKGGLAPVLDDPISADMVRALDGTGVAWRGCDPASLPAFGYTKRIHRKKIMRIVFVPLSDRRAAAVRWYDETFPTKVRALSREVMVVRR
ncbi:hypothetical protein [Sulfitobacter sp. S190]|uniref:hypothetical protein n=1 Tax=Sulfitobacter sp. S190 TaxID=2867022 RepID=UPI0021A5ACDB|nr:hypothetical protein [Sulfitobacter sp. S190]UWR23774.1 hypothetical protein K3756_07375 [Sulfitobacter sp. S190]